MSRDITALTSSSAVEYVEPGRGQLGAQKSTITSSDDSTNLSNEQKTREYPASPSLEHTYNNNRKDNTHNDEDLNEIACKIRDVILDDLGGKQSIQGQDPAAKQLDQNNRPQDSARYTSHTMASMPIGDSLGPLVVVSTHCASSPPIEERLQSISIMVDEPDPRLIDALRKPLDRPLILKVEQEVVAFITGTLDSYDTSPLNSYHRMLVHKIAEFYRLTHIISPDAIDCVRLFRGHAARIPPVKLSDMASQKPPPATPPSGTQLAAVKIMRRKSPSEKGVDSESDQIGDGRGYEGTQANDLLKLMTREEKEAAYQLARARIFGDFKESPPESPSPSKSSNERQMLHRSIKEQDDGFQSRSQYPYHIVTQAFPNFGNPGNTFSPNSYAVPGPSGPTQSSHTLNPAAVSFSPNSGAFIPAPLAGPVQSQQYPVTFTHGGGYPVYPPVQHLNMSSSVTRPNLNRPMIPPSANRFTSITPLPYGCQSNHRNAASRNSQPPPMNPGFVPTTADSSREPPQLGRTADQHTGSDVTYLPSLPYFGHQNSSTNGTVNGRMSSGMNGGWSLVSANSVQKQGRFTQGDGPLRNGQPGNLGPYGEGRG